METAYTLMEAIKQRGVASIRQLSRELHMSPHTVIDYLRFFEEKGWVKSERIGRTKLVALTPEGEKVLEQLSQIITQFSVP